VTKPYNYSTCSYLFLFISNFWLFCEKCLKRMQKFNVKPALNVLDNLEVSPCMHLWPKNVFFCYFSHNIHEIALILTTNYRRTLRVRWANLFIIRIIYFFLTTSLSFTFSFCTRWLQSLQLFKTWFDLNKRY
jgi:hypothetical protein